MICMTLWLSNCIDELTGNIRITILLCMQVGEANDATCLWRSVEVKWMRLDEVDLINFEASHPSA